MCELENRLGQAVYAVTRSVHYMLVRLTIHSHISPPPSPPTLLTPSVPATPRVENIITSSHYLVTFKISASLADVSPRTPCMCTLTHSTQPANISKKVTWTGTSKHIQTCQLACVHMVLKRPTAVYVFFNNGELMLSRSVPESFTTCL